MPAANAEPKSFSSERDTDQPVEPCPSDPTIEARWSKSQVTPNHNVNWPPDSPPTDEVPEEAKVQCLVTTTDVPDGAAATIWIYQCTEDLQVYERLQGPYRTAASFRNPTIANLQVRGNQVVDPATDEPPMWWFDSPEFMDDTEDAPWHPWDKPFYYFKVQVDYQGLEAETPKDCEAQRGETLQVLYWSTVIADAYADDKYSGSNLSTLEEMDEIAGIIRQAPDHQVITHAAYLDVLMDPDVARQDSVGLGECCAQCAEASYNTQDRYLECPTSGAVSPSYKCSKFTPVEPERHYCPNCAHYDRQERWCRGDPDSGLEAKEIGYSAANAPTDCPHFQMAEFVQCQDCKYFEHSGDPNEIQGTCTSDHPYGGVTGQPSCVKRLCPSFEAAPDHEPWAESVANGNDAAVQQNPFTPDLLGSLIRNTCIYHQTSHGLDDDGGQINFGGFAGTRIGRRDVHDSDNTPSLPRVLVYLNCCLCGKEPGLAGAFTHRGTQYVIAFRVSIPDRAARRLATQFYTRWQETSFCPDDVEQAGQPVFLARWHHRHEGIPVERDFIQVMINGRTRKAFALHRLWHEIDEAAATR